MRPTLSRVLAFALVIAPVAFAARLVWTRSVDVGCWDMWENAPLLQHWQDWRDGRIPGAELWRHLYAAQIQHRIVVPRLILIGLTHLSGGDFRWESWFTFALLLIQAWLIWILVRRTVDLPWRWPLMLAANLLVFSPIHYQTLLWGSSMWSTLPATCLLGVLALFAAPRGRRLAWRAAAAVLLAEIATHSFAHGLALWPVVIVLILLFEPAAWRTRIAAAIPAGLVAAATVFCYFADFINAAHHAYDLDPGDHALKGAGRLLDEGRLEAAAKFFLGFIGAWFARNPFAGHPLAAARILGAVTLAAFLGLASIFTLHRGARRSWRAALPWLTLGIYVIGVGVMVSKRGADIGEHRAVTPRYLEVSQFLVLSIPALLLALRRADPESAAGAERNGPPAPSIASAALLAAFVTAQIPVWQYGLHLADVWYHARRQAQALVLFLPHLKPDSLKVLDKESKNWRCLDAVRTLQDLGLLQFRPLESPDLKWFAREAQPLGTEKAAITSASFREDGAIELAGHARFAAGRPADAVLLTRGERVIALGQPAPRHLLRIYGLDYEFANAEEVPVSAMYPWKGVAGPAALPDAAGPIEAWALDVARMRIAKIRNAVEWDKAAKTVTLVPSP